MKLVFAIGLCILSAFAMAQKPTVKGKVFDSLQNKPLPLASVAIYRAVDTSLLTYRLAGNAGEFSISGLPLNQQCRLVITYQGYGIYRKEFMLDNEKLLLDFGQISLTEDAKALEEITVSAERPPVIMRNDTLEFNASSFKTLPTALVEDLLKKLPGVTVDRSGGITVNGRKVNRLLVDGKEFFGNDYRIATRNLPADVVDKIQVADDAEERRRNPRIQTQNLGQVVNIKLKKAIRKGWFGKVYGGGGSSNRHEAGGIVNTFRDTMQVSVLGFSNNVNKQGFEPDDLYRAGGYDRGGGDNMNYNYIRDGIQKTLGGGLNFNHQTASRLTLNFHYFYNSNERLNQDNFFEQKFFDDTLLLTSSNYSNTEKGNQNRLGASLRWKIDSLTQLEFRPRVAIGLTRGQNVAYSATSDNFKGAINQNQSLGSSAGKNNSYEHSLSFSTSSRKVESRNLSINFSTAIGSNEDDDYQDNMFRIFANGRDSLLQQVRSKEYKNLRHSVGTNLSQLVTKWASVTLRHEAQYERNSTRLDVFSKPTGADHYSVYQEDLSNGVKNEGWQHQSGADVDLTYKQWAFSPGINLLWFRNDNRFPKASPVNQRLFFAYPSLEIRWKGLGLQYENEIRPPNPGDLRRIIDISDPFYKQLGNPELQATQRETVQLSFFSFLRKSHSSLNFSLRAGRQKNAVIYLVQLDSARVETSQPVNISGAKDFSFFGVFNRQFRSGTKFTLALQSNLSAYYNEDFVSINGVLSKAARTGGRLDMELFANMNDVLEVSQQYKLSYRGTRFVNKENYRNVDVATHEITTDLALRWPGRFVWNHQLMHSHNPQVSQGFQKSVLRWNASVHYAFTKNEQAQIKLSVYDLLNQNRFVDRYTDGVSVQDSQSIGLTRYGLISLVYNIRYFGGRQSLQGGRNRF